MDNQIGNKMIKLLTTILVIVFLASPAMAEKPEWAGKGKPSAEQKAAHKAAMNAKEGKDEDEGGDRDEVEKKDKREKKAVPKKGLEKQQAKKSDQLQNELDKGSETGKESRATNKKWWKFWE